MPTSRGSLRLLAVWLAASVLPAGLAAAPPTLDVPHAATVPRVDADPDDPAWRTAAVIPRLTRSLNPGADARAPVPTRVLLLWNEEALFIRFVCSGTDVYAPFSGHDDPLFKGDVVEVFLDARGDGRQYVELQVSPDNVTLDKLFLLTAPPLSDARGKLRDAVLSRDFWEFLDWTLPGLRTAARRVSTPGEPGWVVDLALPSEPLLRRLGRTRFKPMTLRANLLRYEWPRPTDPAAPRSLLAMNWAPVVNGCPHISPAAMGTLRLKARVGGAPTRLVTD